MIKEGTKLQLSGEKTQMMRWAFLSENEKYRYLLGRRWTNSEVGIYDMSNMVCFIGLNPSTADGREDDPTIRRLIGFAKREGYYGFIILNLFAYRSRNPSALDIQKDPYGPLNPEFIREYAEACKDFGGGTIVMWGSKGKLFGAQTRMLTKLKEVGDKPRCFGISKAGTPVHPLYLPNDTPIIKWKKPEIQ